MEKILSFRSQPLFGEPNFPAGHWSLARGFTPADEATLKRRGHLFVVATLKGPPTFEASAAGKIITDAMQEEYYSLLEGSPLSALEKAVVAAHRRLLDIAHGTTTGTVGIDFDIVAAVLWGNILYLARLGTAAVYLLRAGEMKEICPAVEAQISVASGMIAPADTLILGSFKFRELFPVPYLEKNLDNLETLVQNNPQKEDLTVLVLRLIEEKEVSPDEVVKFVSPTKEKINAASSKIIPFLSRLLKRKEPEVSFPAAAVISGLYLDRSSPRQRQLVRKQRFVFLTLAVVVLFIVSTVYTLRTQQKVRVAKEVASLSAEAERALLSATDFIDLNNRKVQELAMQAKELAGKITLLGDKPEGEFLNNRADQILSRAIKASTRDHAELIYDFLIQGRGSAPTALAGDGRSLYVADAGTDSLYKLLLTQAPVKVERLGGEQLSQVRLLSLYDGDLFGLDKNGLFRITLDKNTVKTNLIKSLSETAADFFNVYLGNLYFLDARAGELNKYSPVVSGYSSKTPWLKDKVDLSSVTGMTNDGNIYLLFKDNMVLKYTLGKAAEFSLTGLPQPLTNGVALFTEPDLADLYILDNGGKRLVVVSKDGVYQKQILLTDKVVSSPSLFWLDRVGKMLYLLDQTKIYRFDLSGEI